MKSQVWCNKSYSEIYFLIFSSPLITLFPVGEEGLLSLCIIWTWDQFFVIGLDGTSIIMNKTRKGSASEYLKDKEIPQSSHCFPHGVSLQTDKSSLNWQVLSGCRVTEVPGLDLTSVSISHIVALVMLDSGLINKPQPLRWLTITQ